MAENDGLTRTPIFVVNLRSVFRGKCTHEILLPLISEIWQSAKATVIHRKQEVANAREQRGHEKDRCQAVEFT